MDARFTQPRTDAPSVNPAAPSAAPGPFHSCISHNCTIRFFWQRLGGRCPRKKERLAIFQSGEPLIANARSQGGGRIRDYPSQKDPIPEVTLQHVPLNCSSSRNQEQVSLFIPNRARHPAARVRFRLVMGQRHVWTRLADGAAKCRDPKGGLMSRETSCLPPSGLAFGAELPCSRSLHQQRTRSAIIDPITHNNSWGVPSFPGRTPLPQSSLPRPGN